jgi:hypothetical protein
MHTPSEAVASLLTYIGTLAMARPEPYLWDRPRPQSSLTFAMHMFAQRSHRRLVERMRYSIGRFRALTLDATQRVGTLCVELWRSLYYCGPREWPPLPTSGCCTFRELVQGHGPSAAASNTTNAWRCLQGNTGVNSVEMPHAHITRSA